MKTILLQKKNVLRENHVNQYSKSRISQFSFTDVIKIKLLAVVTPPYIYNGCSNWKAFWEVKFTPLNINVFGCYNVRKHREINNGEKYITLDISLNFGRMEKMKITSSEPKDYLGKSGKGLITSLGIKKITRSKRIKEARFAITNTSIKDLSNIIKEFEDLPYEGYVRKRSCSIPGILQLLEVAP